MRSFDEMAEQGVRGSETVLVNLPADELTAGTVSFLTIGFGEAGNYDFVQVVVYLCWALDVDLAESEVGQRETVDCPASTDTFVASFELVSI